LRDRDANIELISGDDLLALVRGVHPHLERKAVLEVARQATERVVTGSDVAYYDGRVYWLLLFEHETYTLLQADGKPLTADEEAVLRPMIEASQALTAYVNLQEEAQAKERARAAETGVVARLMLAGGKAAPATITQHEQQDASADLGAAAERLLASGVISKQEDGELCLPDSDYPKVVTAFRALFTGPCPIPPLGCPWYDDHINPCLLKEIQVIQGGLALDDDIIDTVLQALRHSPSALGYALHPIAVIVNGREQLGEAVVPPGVTEIHQDYFLKVLFDSLQADFTRPELSNFYYVTRGVRELELKGSRILKSQTGVCLQHDYRQRYTHGFIEGMGDRAFLVMAPNHAPETWASPSPAPASTEPDAGSG
jgi:hypothetical protein